MNGKVAKHMRKLAMYIAENGETVENVVVNLETVSSMAYRGMKKRYKTLSNRERGVVNEESRKLYFDTISS